MHSGESMSDHERKRWADVARGFAIITVVFFHVAIELGRLGQVHWKVGARSGITVLYFPPSTTVSRFYRKTANMFSSLAAQKGRLKIR